MKIKRPAVNPQPRPMKFFDVPVLRYVGAKWMLADWIISNFPPHRAYIEPFAGSCAVFLRKPPSSVEVLNDLNCEIVNFLRVLRSRPEELVAQIALTPWSVEEYRLSYKPSDDPLEAARRFYTRCWQSFSGTSGTPSGWRNRRYSVGRASLPKEFQRLDGLWGAAIALTDAVIENKPALEVIQYYDAPDVLFYVDPPYVKRTRSGGGHTRYAHEMSDQDHRDLADVLRECRGMVLLSGYDSELYRELYPDWQTVSKTATTNGNSVATEYLWLSPNASDASLPLFSHTPGSYKDARGILKGGRVR